MLRSVAVITENSPGQIWFVQCGCMVDLLSIRIAWNSEDDLINISLPFKGTKCIVGYFNCTGHDTHGYIQAQMT